MAKKINITRELIDGFFVRFYDISDRSRTLDRRMVSGARYSPDEPQRIYYQCVRAEKVLEIVGMHIHLAKRKEVECWKSYWQGKCESLGIRARPEDALRV